MHKPDRLFSARDAIAMMQTLTICAWPITVLAASQSLGLAMASVSFLDWMALLLLSFMSGLVALLTRVRTSLEVAAANATLERAGKAPADNPAAILIPWYVFAGVHMIGSIFAGMLCFFACEWLDWNSFLEAIAIALASYSGAKWADRLADGFSDAFIGRMSAIFGGAPKERP